MYVHYMYSLPITGVHLKLLLLQHEVSMKLADNKVKEMPHYAKIGEVLYSVTTCIPLQFIPHYWVITDAKHHSTYHVPYCFMSVWKVYD